MDESPPNDDQPSKSARKREMIELQKLGEELVGLSDRELARIPIESERLRDAISLARSIRHHSGKRRQLQLIGKIMREIDATPIRDALDALHQGHQQETDAFHEIEQVRDRLVSEGDSALSDALAKFPAADRQHLRQLIRQAQRESSAGKAPAASRKLFKYLRSLSG